MLTRTELFSISKLTDSFHAKCLLYTLFVLNIFQSAGSVNDARKKSRVFNAINPGMITSWIEFPSLSLGRFSFPKLFLIRYTGRHITYMLQKANTLTDGLSAAGVVPGFLSQADLQLTISIASSRRLVLVFPPVTGLPHDFLEVLFVGYSSLRNHNLTNCPASEESNTRPAYRNSKCSRKAGHISGAWHKVISTITESSTALFWTITDHPLKARISCV